MDGFELVGAGLTNSKQDVMQFSTLGKVIRLDEKGFGNRCL